MLAVVKHLLAEDIRPRDIVTRASMINATRVVAAMGGSTNGVLHLLALAREAEVDFHVIKGEALLFVALREGSRIFRRLGPYL